MLLSWVTFIHLMSLVVWIGSMIFFSFVGAPVIFKVLGRELAGDVVGDIFPKYWLIGYVCSTTALGSLIFLWRFGMTGVTARVILLSVMMVSTFYTGLSVGPNAAETKAERSATEDVEKKEELRHRFSKTHRHSMVMNIMILILGIVTVFITAYYSRI